MNYDQIISQKIQNIKPSGIRKFFDLASSMEGVISLGVGEPDFDTPWHIREEGIYSLEKGRTFYTSNAGLKDLKIEICNYLKRRFDVEYDYNKEVMVTVGGSEAIDIENVVLGSLIGQISIFDCGKTDDFGDLSCLFLEYADELFADDLSLSLRLLNAS